TNNQNKLKEVQAQLPDEIKLISLKDIGCYEDIPETQKTIEGNAIQKANYIKMKYNKDCFADDTGLEVMALNGAPGVHSARYAGPEKNSKKNIEKLLSSLEKTGNRSAQFKTVIALHYKGELIQFEGICEGKITRTAKGSGGFGYDPIFKPSVKDKTFAELTLKEKNEIGHRGIAVAKLIAFFNKHS
ncbi:RdgB/HAM1 family non-canonical purine NTP pyrophosphatase, partial [Flavobacteriaceae bacterium]|nr:RdgB/HAM1 family non-canonical purine NTP pyrophosphatase [Flavobacteriaceae bacterium]